MFTHFFCLVSERNKKKKSIKRKRLRMEEFCGEPLLSLSSSWNTSSPRLSQCLSRTVSTTVIVIVITINREPIIRRIAISKVCPGAADSPVCDPSVVYPLIPQQAQDAGQQRQSALFFKSSRCKVRLFERFYCYI